MKSLSRAGSLSGFSTFASLSLPLLIAAFVQLHVDHHYFNTVSPRLKVPDTDRVAGRMSDYRPLQADITTKLSRMPPWNMLRLHVGGARKLSWSWRDDTSQP